MWIELQLLFELKDELMRISVKSRSIWNENQTIFVVLLWILDPRPTLGARASGIGGDVPVLRGLSFVLYLCNVRHFAM